MWLATVHFAPTWLHFYFSVIRYNYFNFLLILLFSLGTYLISHSWLSHPLLSFFLFFFFFFNHYFIIRYFFVYGQPINLIYLIINILLGLVELFLMDSINILYSEGFYKLGLCPKFKIYHSYHFKFSTKIYNQTRKFLYII